MISAPPVRGLREIFPFGFWFITVSVTFLHYCPVENQTKCLIASNLMSTLLWCPETVVGGRVRRAGPRSVVGRDGGTWRWAINTLQVYTAPLYLDCLASTCRTITNLNLGSYSAVLCKNELKWISQFFVTYMCQPYSNGWHELLS